METYQVALVVGIVFVLPQVAGFTAARVVGRRASAALWPLAAAGTVGLFWAYAAYRAGEHTRAAGTFRCGTPEVGSCLFFISMMVMHFAVGSILSVLDQRAQARTRSTR
jgi:hypothetical protein